MHLLMLVLLFLKEAKEKNSSSEEMISLDTGIAVNRVATVCTKSKIIKSSVVEKQSWSLR